MRFAPEKMVSTFATLKTKPRMKPAILPDFLSLFTCKAFHGIFFTAVNLNEHKIDILKKHHLNLIEYRTFKKHLKHYTYLYFTMKKNSEKKKSF